MSIGWAYEKFKAVGRWPRDKLSMGRRRVRKAKVELGELTVAEQRRQNELIDAQRDAGTQAEPAKPHTGGLDALAGYGSDTESDDKGGTASARARATEAGREDWVLCTDNASGALYWWHTTSGEVAWATQASTALAPPTTQGMPGGGEAAVAQLLPSETERAEERKQDAQGVVPGLNHSDTADEQPRQGQAHGEHGEQWTHASTGASEAGGGAAVVASCTVPQPPPPPHGSHSHRLESSCDPETATCSGAADSTDKTTSIGTCSTTRPQKQARGEQPDVVMWAHKAQEAVQNNSDLKLLERIKLNAAIEARMTDWQAGALPTDYAVSVLCKIARGVGLSDDTSDATTVSEHERLKRERQPEPQAGVVESVGVASAGALADATCGSSRSVHDVKAVGTSKRQKLHDKPVVESVCGPTPRLHTVMMNRWREVAQREASRDEQEQSDSDLQRWEAEQRRCGAAESNPNFIPLGIRK